MKTLSGFQVHDHLAHAWKDELVGFRIDAALAGNPGLRVVDESDRVLPSQVSRQGDGASVFFVVDELEALGSRQYRLVEGARAPRRVASPGRPSASVRGSVVTLGNGIVSVRIPGAAAHVAEFPAPVLGIRRGAGKWIGAGRLFLSDFLAPRSVESRCVEQGPLWVHWEVVYLCQGGERYTVQYKVQAGRPYVEITEVSELCRDSRWEFSVRRGLEPDSTWTHAHQVRRDAEGRWRDIPFAQAKHRHDVGSIQLPVYSGIWVPDDYYYCGFLSRAGAATECIAAGGVNGGFWDYPYENQIDVCFSERRDAFFRGSIKAGHRRWLLIVADRDEVTQTRPYYRNAIHQSVKRYETPLHKAKDYILDWDDVPAAGRPFLLANREQLGHAQKVATRYPPLKEYVASLNPGLPGDYTYYHAGTHRVFAPDCRNDPAVLYVTADSPEARAKQARFLKDVVMTGLANRRAALLDHVGHCDNDMSSINVGRGLRPWVALYDFAAAENAFSEEEHRLAKATFALFCYKINDPDYWPADHLVLRDDHPRSAHRTHWFPGRQSDWAFYNIDNIPHNFHGDLWSACGCVALAFPKHPESRAWVNRTLEFWESELTQWVFPEGAWLESSTYTLNSMKDYLLYCRGLANAHIRDYFSDERLQRVFRFYAETLLPHDRRINKASIPVIGDASYPNGFGYVLGWMAGLSGADPEFSGMMNAVWRQTGEFLTEPGRFGLNFCDFLFLNPFIEDRPAPERKSRHYHGLGVMLRHAPGTADDIYMFIKGGIIYSHFHEPEGTFLLWWNGQPLCDEYGVQYGKGTSEYSQHNCIEVRAGSTCCYNKGDVTRSILTPQFDFVTVDAPILQAWLQPGDGIWGFRGEMGPAGWHRRHLLLMKPHYLFVVDDLECAHPTTYHLNVMADGYRKNGNHVHFDGRHGTDLEFVSLDLDGREIRHSEFDVAPSNQAFVPPPKFYHQLQLHIDGVPRQGFSTILVPHRKAVAAKAGHDASTGGARIEIGGQVDRAMVFPSRRRVATPEVEFEGTAGAIRTTGEGTTLMLVEGTRIGVPGKLRIEGDGPFTAELTKDGKVALSTDGVGRWLTLSGGRFGDGRRVEVGPGRRAMSL